MYYVVINYRDNTTEYLGTYGGLIMTTPRKERRIYFEDRVVADSTMEQLFAQNVLPDDMISYSVMKCNNSEDERVYTQEV